MNYIISSLIGAVLAIGGALGGWFSGEKVFDKQPEQLVGVFSDPFISLQLATDPTNGECLTTDGTNNVWSTSCGTGGGGSGGGTWSTTTSSVSGSLVNYPNNTSDIVAIGSNATTSAEYWFDPNTVIAYISGKLGLGDTTPDYPLDVTGSIRATGVIDAPNFTATSTTATSTFAGSVGIGTTSPSAKLALTGNGTSAIMAGDAGFSNCSSVKLSDGSPISTTNYHLTSCTSDQSLFYNTPTNRGHFWRINNSDTMTLSSAGNLGIGSTSAFLKFAVVDTSNGGGIVVSSSAANTGLKLVTTGTGGETWNIHATDNLSGWGGGKLVITEGGGFGAVRAAFIDGGNFGLGTTGPNELLHLKRQNDASNVSARIQNNSTNASSYASLVFTVTTNDYYNGQEIRAVRSPSNELVFLTDSTERLRINATGIGIGTSSPYAKLSVVGNVVASTINATSTNATSTFAGFLEAARLNITGSATNTSSIGFNITSGCYAINGTCVSGGTGGSGTVSSGTAGQSAYYASNGTTVTGTSTIFVSTGSNVGIGTSSPTAKLQINETGFTSTREYIIKGGVSDAGNDLFYVGNSTNVDGRLGPTLGGYVDSTTAAQSLVFRGLTSSANDSGTIPIITFQSLVTSSATDPNNGTFSSLSTRPTFSFINGTSANTQLIILADGNIGIGTTSPYAKLSVVGDVVAASYFATSTIATSTFAGGFRVTGTRGIRLDDFASCTALETNSSGDLACGTDDTTAGSGGSNWNLQTNFNANALTPTTTVPVWLKSNLYSSSTAIFSGSGTSTFRGSVAIGTSTTVFGEPLLEVGGYATTSPVANNIARFSDNRNTISSVLLVNTNTGSAADMRFAVTDTAGNYLAFAGPGIGNTQTLFGATRSTMFPIFVAGSSNRSLTLGTFSSGNVIFGTNNIERMRILGVDGKVGIGTTSPYTQLAVVGNVAASTFIATSTTATSTFSGNVDMSTGRVKMKTYPSFSFPAGINTATTTTATTTIAIGTAFISQQYNAGECFTGSGTIGYRITDGTNAMDYVIATSTVSRFKIATNNTFQVGEKRFVEIGPMTASYLSCTFDVTQHY